MRSSAKEVQSEPESREQGNRDKHLPSMLTYDSAGILTESDRQPPFDQESNRTSDHGRDATAASERLPPLTG